jgi:haloacetate dehalogenase
MASDQLAVMRSLGFERFALAAHDRGSRVALRMALDHPDAVSHLAVLDIVPTKTIYDTIDRQRTTAVWRYFFLIQPHDLPEQLIAAGPSRSGALRPARLDATCEDYRAGASIDLKHDEADADRTVACPTLAIWRKTGLGSSYDVPRVWSQRAPRLSAHAVDCGHFLAEERPEKTISALLSFMCGTGRPVRTPHRS